MTDIRKRLEQVIDSAQRKLIENNEILPIKTHEGILVGSVKIVSNDALKDLWQYGELVYTNISLNKTAIKLANLLARHRKRTIQTDNIYKMDQEYGNLLHESNSMRERLHNARKAGNHDKADIYLARYTYAKDKAQYAKLQILALVNS